MWGWWGGQTTSDRPSKVSTVSSDSYSRGWSAYMHPTRPAPLSGTAGVHRYVHDRYVHPVSSWYSVHVLSELSSDWNHYSVPELMLAHFSAVRFSPLMLWLHATLVWYHINEKHLMHHYITHRHRGKSRKSQSCTSYKQLQLGLSRNFNINPTESLPVSTRTKVLPHGSSPGYHPLTDLNPLRHTVYCTKQTQPEVSFADLGTFPTFQLCWLVWCLLRSLLLTNMSAFPLHSCTNIHVWGKKHSFTFTFKQEMTSALRSGTVGQLSPEAAHCTVFG